MHFIIFKSLFKYNILILIYKRVVNVCFLVICREKKRDKERDELWKRLGELEISYKDQNNLNSVNDRNSMGSSSSTADHKK